MTARIQALPALVANQIAAGEVIERPASVVKELLENSLDAGADTINIDIGYGGLNHIKISDNGFGILAEDLPLAIAAHATSKIKALDDLFVVQSMGFRGEALASIAAVSRLSILSQPSAQAHAMMLRVDELGMQVVAGARSLGTTIDVRDLFFNTPVRKKFLKSAQLEYQAIEAVIKRFALSAPQIALTLKHDNKVTLSLLAASCEQSQTLRVRKVMGKAFIEQAIYLDVERAGMRLHGWLSTPHYQRSQSDKQWIYINQRMVKDKLLYHAIKQSYEALLHPGRYPSCVLYLTMPVAEIDVNVHPTKHEVRFQQPRLVHDFIVSQLSQALRMSTYAAESLSAAITVKEPLAAYEGKPPLIKSLQPLSTDFTSQWIGLDTQYALIFLDNTRPHMVDVVRIMYDKLRAELTTQPLPFKHRALLVPICYVLNQKNIALFEQFMPWLAQFGLEFDFLSETKVIVRTIPQALPLLDVQQLLIQLPQIEVNRDALLTLLITCHPVNVLEFSDEEKQDVMTYLSQSQGQVRTGCIQLDNERCRALIYD